MMDNRRISSEDGAAIVFIALVSVVLMLMVGLAIDSGILYTSKTSHEHTADMIALTAIESLASDATSTTEAQKLQNAAAEASRIAGMNLDLWVARGLIQDGDTDQGDVGVIVDPNTRASSGENGYITPGQWFFEKPDECDSSSPAYDAANKGFDNSWMNTSGTCPCRNTPNQTDPISGLTLVDADGWKGACFAEVANTQEATLVAAQVNAVRVVLTTDDGSGVQSTFSAADGREAFRVSSEAVAAFVPRHILLAVDISSSSTEETHGFRINSVTGDGDHVLAGDFAYQVPMVDNSNNPYTTPPALPATGLYTFDNIDHNLMPNNPHNGFDVLRGMSFSCLGGGWSLNNRMSTGGTPAQIDYCSTYYPTPPLRQQNDYYRLPNFDTRDGRLTEGDPVQFGDLSFEFSNFLLDLNPHNPPQPLTNILRAVHTAMSDVQTNGYKSDRVGFVGFDDDILEPRVTLDPFGEPALLQTSDPTYQSFVDATNIPPSPGAPVALPISVAQKDLHFPYVDKFLFPRSFSGEAFRTSGTNPPETQSALPLVMRRSLKMFDDAPNSDLAKSMLIMFSDGMGTCPDFGVPGDEGGDRLSSYHISVRPTHGTGPKPVVIGNTSTRRAEGCSPNDPRYNFMAIEDMIELAREEFAANNVEFSLFLFGAQSAPHTLVKQMPSGSGCQGPDGANTDDLSTYDATNGVVNSSYYQIGDNIFPGNGNYGGFNNVQDDYQNRSNGAPWYLPNVLSFATRLTGGTFVPVRPPCASDIVADLDAACSTTSATDGVVAGGDRTAPLLVPVDENGITIYPESVDPQGRLLCDPQARSRPLQVQEELQDMISDNPYLLVSEKRY